MHGRADVIIEQKCCRAEALMKFMSDLFHRRNADISDGLMELIVIVKALILAINAKMAQFLLLSPQAQAE